MKFSRLVIDMLRAKISLTILISVTFLINFNVLANEPVVGRKAAAKWLQKADSSELDTESKKGSRRPSAESTSDSMLMLHIGGFVSSKAYEWGGSGTKENPARSTYGATYLFDEWGRMDVNARIDFNEFQVGSERPKKLSVLPFLTFPAADTKFPLYFGFGAGVGIFFKQIEEESSLSLDYQLAVGARLFELYESMGAFVEYGMKNHIHLFSDGQLNATHLTAGLLFTF